MKTLINCLLMLLLLSPFAQLPLKAEHTAVSTSAYSDKTGRRGNEKATLARLKAIRELAKTKLSAAEKKELREEVKAIKSKSERPGGAIYISTGALVLIIVLLIILL